MYNAEENRKQIRLANYHDDIPQNSVGFLIPPSQRKLSQPPKKPMSSEFLFTQTQLIAGEVATVLLLAIIFGTTSSFDMKGANVLATSIVSTTNETVSATVVESPTDDFKYEPKVAGITAPHYLMADIANETILAASGFEAEAPIASITKLMTALIAIEKLDLDTIVNISEDNFSPTLIPRLKGHSQASLYSLLQLLLIESSNEAAEVIAGEIGLERFIALMNDKADELGLTHTTFRDPSGIDGGNVSSVGDLFRLVQYINANQRLIWELTLNQNPSSHYTGGEFGELENFNLIKGLENMVGGKIGETLAAGQTSISLHKVTIGGEERILVLVLLGSSNRTEDVNTLLNYATEQFIE